MKYFHIDSRIDKEMYSKFLEFANANGEEEWTIILYTVGGFNVIAKNILFIINNRVAATTLICNEAYSAGFSLFYEAKCKKVMCHNSKGMTHLAAAEMFMQSNGKPSYSEDECIVKNWKQSKKKDKEWVKIFLTKKEYKNYKNGKDVYFNFNRMKEIFPEAEVI